MTSPKPRRVPSAYPRLLCSCLHAVAQLASQTRPWSVDYGEGQRAQAQRRRKKKNDHAQLRKYVELSRAVLTLQPGTRPVHDSNEPATEAKVQELQPISEKRKRGPYPPW